MTEMDLMLYEFTVRLRKQAEKMDEIGDAQGVRASAHWYGKAEAYRDIADMIEAEFRDKPRA